MVKAFAMLNSCTTWAPRTLKIHMKSALYIRCVLL